MGEIFGAIRNIEDCWVELGGAFVRAYPSLKEITSNTMKIEKVIFNNPATIVYWNDGTKTVVKCQEGDFFDKEKGLAMAIIKKMYGNKGSYNKVFDKWIKE